MIVTRSMIYQDEQVVKWSSRPATVLGKHRAKYAGLTISFDDILTEVDREGIYLGHVLEINLFCGWFTLRWVNSFWKLCIGKLYLWFDPLTRQQTPPRLADNLSDNTNCNSWWRRLPQPLSSHIQNSLKCFNLIERFADSQNVLNISTKLTVLCSSRSSFSPPTGAN